MATLQDVNYSLHGEKQVQLATQADSRFAGLVKYKLNEKTGKPIYPEGKDWYLFKLVESNKQGGVYIPNIDDVVNPDTITDTNKKGTVERARLLAGVGSIWVKDQKDLTPEYIRQNGRSIVFPRGHKILRVAAHDKTMLQMCRMTNSNIGNPFRVSTSRFEMFEYDSSIAELESFKREEFELEMALIAKGAKSEEMRKHASFLGIRMLNDIGEKKSDDGVRREYVMYAKRQPQYFKDTLGSPQIEISWLVKKAISDSLIEIGREPQKAYWANGGGFIGTYPQSQNPEQYLIELAMTNTEEGINFKEQLKRVAT